MKKHFILGIMALAALVSCTKSEVLNQESLQEKGIKFTAYAGKSVQTKAVSIYQDSLDDAGIGILAWRTGDADIDETILDGQAPEFMNNIKLTWAKGTDGTYTGSYSPERYWPSTGAKVSFFAYAPYSKGDGTTGTGKAEKYHPENISIPQSAGTLSAGAHKLTLKVSDTEFDKHTDFMVARVGNGENNSGVDANYINVGVNQNLDKNYEGAVKLQMVHALSRISFEAKATGKKNVDGNLVDNPQNEPYSEGLVKVVLNDITVVGTFANEGTYNLFGGNWTIDAANTFDTGYELRNTDTDDPFNKIADEWYNIQIPDGENGDESNKPDEDGWYKLNKSTHDLMVIPFNGTGVAATITNIVGSYTVKTYAQKVESVAVDPNANPVVYEDKLVYLDATGNETYEAVDASGNAHKPAVGNELTQYQDIVYFGMKLENSQWVDDPFPTPITLEAGKHYKFRFNIHLKKIEFSVAVDEWEDEVITNIVE